MKSVYYQIWLTFIAPGFSLQWIILKVKPYSLYIVSLKTQTFELFCKNEIKTKKAKSLV